MKVIVWGLAGFILSGLGIAIVWSPGFSLAGMNDAKDQERTKLRMQQAKLTPGVKIPPLDVLAPAHTETATFALG
jgi:hypothetical protein